VTLLQARCLYAAKECLLESMAAETG